MPTSRSTRRRQTDTVPCALFDQTMYDREVRRVELDERLRRALSSQDLSVYYQPVLDLETGTITVRRGARPLVRRRAGGTGARRAHLPGRVHRQRHCARRVGDGQAIRQAAEWQRAGHSLVDRRQHLHQATADRRSRRDRRSAAPPRSLDPRLLILEVTESVLLEDADRAISTMDRLHALGIRIAIDDFGTGYSSLTYLSRLPVDQLKVDRFFVVRPRHSRVEHRDRADDRPALPRPRPHGDRRRRRATAPARTASGDGREPPPGLLDLQASVGHRHRRVSRRGAPRDRRRAGSRARRGTTPRRPGATRPTPLPTPIKTLPTY